MQVRLAGVKGEPGPARCAIWWLEELVKADERAR